MKRAASAAILVLCAASAFGFSPEYIHPRLGVLVIKNDVSGGQIGAPNAVANTLGLCLTFPFTKNPAFTFEPGLDVFWTYYEWDSTDGRAHITEELESASAAVVVGALLDAPVLWRWNLTPSLWLKMGLGGAINVRAAFAASGSNVTGSEVGSIAAFLYQNLRWFYPDAQLRLSYQLQERFTFEFTARGFLPLSNAWDSDAPSFWDQGMLSLAMGMRIRLN